MSFNCSIFLEDIDLNCTRSSAGGINRVVLGLQKDMIIHLNPSDETIVDHAELTNSVSFEHNAKDGTTSFTEAKTTSNGLGVVTTEILIRLPRLDGKINKIDYMSRRQDIVAILYHNNGTATISGWMDGLTMDFSGTSGSARSQLSYVDVTLKTDSWIASLSVEDPGIIQLP
jgi:hypothetical protein